MTWNVGDMGMAIKVCVIICVWVAAECAIQSIKLMASFRLQRQGRSPVMFRSDINLNRMYATLRRIGFFAYIGFAIIGLLTFALLPAEMVSELGVTNSNRCAPRRITTSGICARAPHMRSLSWTQLISNAFLVEDTNWDNEEITSNPIYQGLREEIDGNEYFGPDVRRNPNLPIIVANCTVGIIATWLPSETRLEFGEDNSSHAEDLKLLSVHYRADNSSWKVYNGLGAVLDDYMFGSALLVSPQESTALNVRDSRATVFECPLSSQISTISWKARNNRNLIMTPRAPIITYNVSCKPTVVKSNQFTNAIFSYRYAQLSRSAYRHPLKVRKLTAPGLRHAMNIPRTLEPHDVVRAVISLKISERDRCHGETFEYTKCGKYNFVMAVPLLMLTSILGLVAVVLKFRSFLFKNLVQAPITADQWSLFALSRGNHTKKFYSIGSDEHRSRYAAYGRRKCIGEYALKHDTNGCHFEINEVFFVDDKRKDVFSIPKIFKLPRSSTYPKPVSRL